ncbi:uncharacterized protein BcabD6B2_19390 [Babesia caballi]|uniref:Variant erythrocyte surface antigen-1, beta subunit n=1 Tax=Babesia caballi TaxID=5871 RepID=A0AAV4LVC4_BABCB|nr:hypothetical protein, conserved [Babesia caballi]
MSNKPSEPAHGFAVPHVILNKLSEGLRPFHPQSQANISANAVENVKAWVSKVEDNALKQLITDFAEGLNKFVDQNNGIVKSPYTPAYSKAAWNSLTTSDKRECAAILLGIMPLVYIGLTYLYWQCEGKGGWVQESLNDGGGSNQGTLQQYMEALGYTDKDLNKSEKGQDIASHLQSTFSTELSTTDASSNEYPNFLKALQDKANQSQLPNTTSPLTSLYLISYYYITNFLYIVEPTSPASPSFLGYSGLAALAGGAYGFNLGGLGTFMSALLAPIYSFIRPSRPLLDCPPDLKEAIDWILRVTRKDGGGGGGQSGTEQLAEAVAGLLAGVKSSSAELQEKLSKIKEALSSGPNKGIINALGNGLAKFIGYKNSGGSGEIGTDGIAVGRSAGQASEPLDPGDPGAGYKLTYHRTLATWATQVESGTGGDPGTNKKLCAKIFLGCVPLCFYGLSYLYWRCSDKGGWKEMQLDGSASKGTDLKHFMDLMAFSAHWLNGAKKGSDVERVMKTSFSEFSTAASGQSYADFLKKFRSSCLQKWQAPSTTANADNFLSGLYLCSTSYFRHQHQMKAATARTPSSIRSMLYWLSGLTMTPQFGDLLDHFSTVVPADFKVAISGSQGPDTLSAHDMMGHLIKSSLSPSWILGTIQGPGNSNNPLLHEIYSSSEFSYPSSPSALLSKLADYAYALQFQLHFLYQQCQNDYRVGCGWRDCRFGSDINATGNPVPSHICQGYNCTDISKCKHNGSDTATQCNHNKNGDPTCGKGSTPSPLQAFITDNLKGFRLHASERSSHMSQHLPGSTCHIPMGFKSADLRKNPAAGGNLYSALRPFCGGFNTPLRQLSEKLGCLTKRTPRTLGDLFGFTWHLNGQLFKTRPTIETLAKKLVNAFGDNPKTVPTFFLKLLEGKASQNASGNGHPTILSLSLESMAPAIPFLYQLFMFEEKGFLPLVLFDLKGIPHQTSNTPQYKGNHDDFYSLFNSDCSNPNTCGKYLYPLTHSDGATYAPRNASTYLSWVLYLTDDLQSWFQEMLDEFKNIDCSKTGCAGQPKCSKHHASGTHGTDTSQCSCPSVVQCGGTLPLLYRHGFRYYSPFELMGGSKDNTKRDCKAFAQQLQSVISGNPLDKLITTIDTFLYAIRWEFFSKLSGFWTIYTGLILYTFFFLLDTLRLRSHLHFPSSNSIAPISLLGTGKAPTLKKFTKLVYFIP